MLTFLNIASFPKLLYRYLPLLSLACHLLFQLLLLVLLFLLLLVILLLVILTLARKILHCSCWLKSGFSSKILYIFIHLHTIILILIRTIINIFVDVFVVECVEVELEGRSLLVESEILVVGLAFPEHRTITFVGKDSLFDLLVVGDEVQ